MLQLNNINDKYSNEGYGNGILAIVSIVATAAVYIGILLDDRKEKKKKILAEKEKQELEKYVQILIQNYSKICQYINSELKNDSFFFKDISRKLNIDHALICVMDRIELAKKLLKIPVPTPNETEDSYSSRLWNYIKKYDVKVKHQNLRDNYCETNGSYFSNQWLNSEKVIKLFKYTDICKKLDDQVIAKLDGMLKIPLEDEHGYTTVDEVFIALFGDDDAYRCGENDDVPDTWDRLVGWYGITQELKKIAQHLSAYLKQQN